MYLSDNQIAQKYGIHRTTIWRWVRNGEFPKPVHLSSGCTRWKEAAVINWEKNKDSESMLYFNKNKTEPVKLIKDFIGEPISIGQQVLFTGFNSSDLYVGVVISIAKSMLEIKSDMIPGKIMRRFDKVACFNCKPLKK